MGWANIGLDWTIQATTRDGFGRSMKKMKWLQLHICPTLCFVFFFITIITFTLHLFDTTCSQEADMSSWQTMLFLITSKTTANRRRRGSTKNPALSIEIFKAGNKTKNHLRFVLSQGGGGGLHISFARKMPVTVSHQIIGFQNLSKWFSSIIKIQPT